jgi:hypothetical protein
MRALLILSLLLIGCATEEQSTLDPDRFTDEACGEPDAVRCLGGVRHQSCQDWLWYDEETCQAGSICAEGLGCVTCDPFQGPTCVGDDVYTCNNDGSLGTFLETCSVDHCQLGYCRIEDCPEGTDLVYVVDSAYRLLSFDPREEAYTFTQLGNLNCPASSPWPGWGGLGAATPFSMSVDRQGIAWVLFTSGQIFHIPVTDTEQCTESNWVPGTDGFELFGMGFVTNSAFGTDETLFIAGGTTQQLQVWDTPRLAGLNPSYNTLTVRGLMSESDRGPELTGTGGGELFAYFPSPTESTVANLNRTTGQNAQAWAIPGLGAELRAWAFAHWGGDYFIFVSFEDIATGVVNQVHRFDRKTGETEVVVDNSPYRIVGAGVSTCAPLLVQ